MGNNFIRDLFSRLKNKISKKDEAAHSEEEWLEDSDDEEVEEELSLREDESIESEVEEEFQEMQQMQIPSTNSAKLSKLNDYLSDIQTENIIFSFFDSTKRPIIHHYFMIFIVIGGTYFTGKVLATKIATLVGPSKQIRPMIPYKKTAKREEYTPIETYNIFNALEKVGDPNEEKIAKKENKKPKNCYESNKKSSLPLKLINTIVLQDKNKSVASINIQNKREPENFREGETIKGLAKIGRINRLNVIFKNLSNEECEFIENIDKSFERDYKNKSLTILDPKKGQPLLDEAKMNKGIANEGNKFKIKNSLREEMLGDISNVLTQARAIQIKNPDGTLAFKMTEIVPGSIYSKLNIQDGDILTKIDGKEIKNLNEVLNLFGRIKDIQNLSISVKRNGEEEVQEYSFED